MNDNLEKDIRKALDQGITAFNCKIENLFNRNIEKANGVKVGKSVRYLFYDKQSGYMKVQFKLEYTPEEIELLEKVKRLSQGKKQLVKEYVEKLSNNETIIK